MSNLKSKFENTIHNELIGEWDGTMDCAQACEQITKEEMLKFSEWMIEGQWVFNSFYQSWAHPIYISGNEEYNNARLSTSELIELYLSKS